MAEKQWKYMRGIFFVNTLKGREFLLNIWERSLRKYMGAVSRAIINKKNLVKYIGEKTWLIHARGVL